ncbi:hypothetical protein P3W85_00395 [Cupriavidus basilensis]|uniref:Uncharacterized protein n=1 Tax=Cupriavidus basilensis TaxID=68895 RepID=A0ABT6AFQ4_9BURK|nr:hypothetical protein [Cupriavidus basilensis]MDF3831427.1 hypothetical protein [Cupriavidus basilensis]
MTETQWNVRVYRDGSVSELGQVTETRESLAHCAALSRFGISEEDLAVGQVLVRGAAIYPDEEFDVSLD